MNKNTARATEHPEHVWETQRQLFTRLYKTEKKTLAEVQRIMQEDYGFNATVRQYKRRIKKWKLEKNSKADEKMHALVALKGSRNRLDMTCVYKLNGKDIAAHKLLRHARSHGLELPDIAVKAVSRRCCATKIRTKGIPMGLASAANNCPGPKEISLQDVYETVTWSLYFIWLDRGTPSDSPRPVLSALSDKDKAFLTWAKHRLETTKLLSTEALLAALYIARFKSQIGSVVSKAGNGSITVTMSAILVKFFQESGCTNTIWAKVSRMPVQKSRLMARELLSEVAIDNVVQLRSKFSDRLQDFILQPPAEPRRVIELPIMPQSDQRTVQSELPDVEMPNIDNIHASSIIANGYEDALDCNMADGSSPVTNDLPDLEMQLIGHDGMNDLQSSNFEALEHAATHAIDEISQDIKNNTFPGMDDHEIELMSIHTSGILPSPPFPSVLAMELPPPTPIIEDTLLAWRSIDSFELQEGPTPDLEDLLDSALWEESLELSHLEQDSVLLQESAEEEPTSRSPMK